MDAHFGGFTLHTDQPGSAGGEGSAPSPFDTFLAALGTCAGVYVLGFCQQRGITTEGLRLIQEHKTDSATGHVSQVRLEIVLPPGFPLKYQAAVIRAAEGCAVKKHLEHPPAFAVKTSVAAPRPILIPG